MESGRNWQLIYLNTGKLFVMIADYYCHFFPSNSAKLYVMLHGSEWHNITFAKPLMSLNRAQYTGHIQDCRWLCFVQRSCNLFQMYAWLTKIRCKKPRTGVPKVPAAGPKIFACVHERDFQTVVILSGKAQCCSFRDSSVLTTASNPTSAELLASVSLEIPQPHSHAENVMHPPLIAS